MFNKILLFLIFIPILLLATIDEDDDDDVKILVAGDVMFDWGLRKTAYTKNEFAPVQKLKSVFDTVDYRMVNLESAIVSNQKSVDAYKSYVFGGHPDELEILQHLNVNTVFLGNNHAMDYGPDGLKETFRHLDYYGLKHIGAGLTLHKSVQPLNFELRGQSFQVVSMSQIGEQRIFANSNSAGVAPYSFSDLKNFAKPTKKKKVHLVSLHWGIEYSPIPENYQKSIGHALIQSGYSVIIGHHPHIPQGIEKYKNGVILYSLGNFIFGSRNQYLNHNIAVILHFSKNQLILCEIVPVFGKFQTEQEHEFRPLNRVESEKFLLEFSVLCEKLNTKIEIRNGRGYISLFKDG